MDLVLHRIWHIFKSFLENKSINFVSFETDHSKSICIRVITRLLYWMRWMTEKRLMWFAFSNRSWVLSSSQYYIIQNNLIRNDDQTSGVESNLLFILLFQYIICFTYDLAFSLNKANLWNFHVQFYRIHTFQRNFS